MDNIKVSRIKLLEILKDNRSKHRKIFEEALEGYRKKAIQLLEERLERVKKGDKINLFFQVTEPVDQTKAYDRVVAMLEMDQSDTICLSENDFKCYVQDDWVCKQQFLTRAANRLYIGEGYSK